MLTPFPLPPSFPPTDTLYYPATTTTTTTTTTTNAADSSSSPLLLFLPGNPGLIGYYRTFLSTLSALNPQLTVLGASHGGFTSVPAAARYSAAWAWRWGPGPWGLKTQVEMKRALLEHVVGVTAPRKVVLIAHSMGTYLSLELLATLKASPIPGIHVAGGIMLFPTVMHIAQSPQGRLMSPFLTSGVVHAAAGALAYALSWLPAKAVRSIVRVATGQSEEAAEVTTAFVTDTGVVLQTLQLAAEEMVEITQDWWEEEVWNAGGALEGEEEKAGGMVFMFGRGDRWVAEKTREEIMVMKGGGAKMVVEERGLPHEFCIHHGEIMAELCGGWLRGILGEE